MASDESITSVPDVVTVAATEDGEIPETTPSVEAETGDEVPLQWFTFDPRVPTRSLMVAAREFHAVAAFNNFTKGVQVSPDGLCILTNSDDHVLRLFELPPDDHATVDQTSLLQAHEGGSIYDFAWYPFMNSQNPSSCIFISTSRDQPIHMWDAFTGELRASYRAYDHLDEITAANAVAFNATGNKIFAGYDRIIRFFDVAQPGRQFVARPLCKTRKSRQGQRGIISTLHFNPDYSGIYAAGSYNGTTYVYTEDTGEELLCLRDHDGKGITQVRFSPDGRYLYTAARRDSSIHCWDIRQSTQIVQSFTRQADTNQRIEFDVHISGKYLVTGSRDCCAMLYDVASGALLETSDELKFRDAVNGVSFFPDGTRGRVAITTGQRHYDLPQDMDDTSDHEGEGEVATTDNQRKLDRPNALHIVELGNSNSGNN